MPFLFSSNPKNGFRITRMDERVVAAMHADLGDDLCAGVDVMGLVGHVLSVVSSSDRL